MKTLMTSIVLCFFLIGNAQDQKTVAFGVEDSIFSKVLNEYRKVWIYNPEKASGIFQSKKVYPVLYLLDGPTHFHSVVGMIKQLSTANGNTVLPEMIIVGIHNTNRFRDLTPTQMVERSGYTTDDMRKNTGGGDLFLDFIEKELKPYIESNYRTAPYSMLVGHSLGGMMAIYTMFQRPQMFQSYIAIDSSIWWNNQEILKEIQNRPNLNYLKGTSLYLGYANTLVEGYDISTVNEDTSEETLHIRSILSLDTFLKNNAVEGFKYKSQFYENDTHGSVPLITEYDGLRFLFKFHRIDIDEKDFENLEVDMVSQIEAHYQNVSTHMGYQVKADENLINRLGYGMLNGNLYERAEQFFTYNTKIHPDSFNVYDSLGDYYVATNNKEKAAESYQKALELQEYPLTREKLEQLKQQ
ncbi:alpha/beta hydrolase-fold protein [Mangrovimonas sp. YM274]|uniref:alpha/beta hydrolase-fold protein n=1 Tax=Mangrovimonas sp. YM274 TaxID=3070660 RepID=UPI0027DD006A|nr:alpha/beta hydrolase-fold protein [Mangrovimonas sp. YM274]WMI67408.1 alpha/beta hydrolase-fold protein [Mangrovimonas sp. YM274]